MARAGVLVVVSILAALVAGTAARATLAPAPGQLKPFTFAQLQRADRVALSCSVHGRRLRGAARRIERKLAPVACEQPPRSKALDGNFVLAP
jgi:hypothetical protein